jgi:hypothetical protein
MGRIRACLERKDVPMQELRHGLASRYHIDHASLPQEVRQAGAPPLVLDVRRQASPMMKKRTRPQDSCRDQPPAGLRPR